MIYGIGTDIIEIARIEATLQRHGERFIRRILTDDELEVFGARQRSAVYLASRFAAKEALAKAFGTGIGEKVSFQGIQITNTRVGKPQVEFIGETRQFASQRGITAAHLSLSDEKHYAVAMAVLES